MTGVSAHNDLMEAVNTEAIRYGTMTTPIGGPFVEGGAGHVAAHKAVCIAMIELAQYANNILAVDPPVTITLPGEKIVGDTGHVADHVLIAAALAVLQAVDIP